MWCVNISVIISISFCCTDASKLNKKNKASRGRYNTYSLLVCKVYYIKAGEKQLVLTIVYIYNLAPKGAKTGYMIFCDEVRKTIKADTPAMSFKVVYE